MQLQIGKKRRSLEEAFDTRTAELRVLSERKYTIVPSPNLDLPDLQTPQLVSSDVKKMELQHSPIRLGTKCLDIPLAGMKIIGEITSNQRIGGMFSSYGMMCMATTRRQCILPNGGS